MGTQEEIINSPTEEVLISKAVKGDKKAFTDLYEIHLSRVYRHIYYRVGTASDAEDLTQEVFLRAWHSIRSYVPGKRPFLAWLYVIAHNLVIDYYRKRGRARLVPLEDMPPAAGARQDSDMESMLDLDTVRRLLAKLSGDEQRVLMLRFVEGLDNPDVASALGKSQGAIRVIQFRALRRLRKLLEGAEAKI